MFAPTLVLPYCHPVSCGVNTGVRSGVTPNSLQNFPEVEMMTSVKRPSSFHEAKPRTPRGEARQREIKAMRAIEELLNLHDESTFQRALAEDYRIVRGSPRYDQIMAIWREQQRGNS